MERSTLGVCFSRIHYLSGVWDLEGAFMQRIGVFEIEDGVEIEISGVQIVNDAKGKKLISSR